MRLRILVMEAEPCVVAGLRSGLEREGHAVDRVSAGDAAIDLATECDYDVIVVDATDRPSDGYRVCRFLRARGRWSPILLLTASRRLEERILGLDAGADDCLQTPFAFAELSARLRALTRRRR
jgi:two-component system OmpR family response regulator